MGFLSMTSIIAETNFLDEDGKAETHLLRSDEPF